MARQLEQQGETVASLVILDANAPNPDQDQSVPTERELLADLVAVFEELAGVVFGISRQEILAEPDNQVAQVRVMEVFKAHAVLFSKGAPLVELQALLSVYRAALLDYESYRIEGHIQDAVCKYMRIKIFGSRGHSQRHN